MHAPVLVAEVISHLAPARGGLFVDCTLGAGGHTRALLDAGATRVLGFDRDRTALALASARPSTTGSTASRWCMATTVVSATCSMPAASCPGRRRHPRRPRRLLDAARRCGAWLQLPGRRAAGHAHGSRQRPVRRRDAPDASTRRRWPTSSTSSARNASRVASPAASSGPASPVRSRRPANWPRSSAVPSLRAAGSASIPRRGPSRPCASGSTANSRGSTPSSVWPSSRLLAGARLAIIAFHSLEDRIVKHTFRALAQAPDPLIALITRRPIEATEDEIARNPRARSAKLRVAERLA